MAQIRIHRDGAVEVFCGTQDIGGGARTVVQLCTSMELGYLPLEKIRVSIGRSEYGASGASAGSSTTRTVAREISDAAKRVLPQLLELAAEKLGVNDSSLQIRDGGVIAPRGKAGLSWTEATALIQDSLIGHAPTLLEPGAQWTVIRDDGTVEQATDENYLA